MKRIKSETIANFVALILMFAMVVSLVAIPSANAQALVMNVSGPVLIHSEVDIDLNGPSSFIENVTLWIKYPGRADFTYIGGYPTTAGGDCDVYDFDFNETGDFALKWALPPDFTVESNVVILEVVTKDMLPSRVVYPFVGAIPNLVGVGQEVMIHVGVTLPLSGVQYGWEGLTVTVTKPDGKTETLGPIKTDSTGGTGVLYVPTMAGNYTLQTHFPEQEAPVAAISRGGISSPAGTRMLAADSETLTLVVQEEPIPYYPAHPLPTEYWTRPIDAQLREWYPIAGSWVTDPANRIAVGNDDAPETAHILWTTPFTSGGLVGGDVGLESSINQGPVGFGIGDAYEGKWNSRFIIAGRLYYTEGGARGDLPVVYHCVDLHTGEELWSKIFLNNNTISFGQLFYWESYNYMGTFAYLWVTVGRTWHAFDAYTGNWVASITNVPSGTTLTGERGEIYRLQVDETNGWMALWNMSARVVMAGSWGNSFDMRTFDAADGSGASERAWAWNVTIHKGLQGGVRGVIFGDRVIGALINETDVIAWGLSLKPGQEGTLLFNNDWKAPAEWLKGGQSIAWNAMSSESEDGVFVLWSSEKWKYYGFSIETGKYLWETASEIYLNFYGVVSERPPFIYDGKLYSSGVGGILYCYDVKTGETLWTYEATDPYTEYLFGNDWWMRIVFFADGKIYVGTKEHSPNQPLPRGGPFICLNATTGELIWRANGLFRQTHWGGVAIIGDSIIATQDTYDQRVYAIGKGPSQTSVSVENDVSTLGSSVLVKGMVTDVSPGTNSVGLTMRFPNGVPAVSDANMTDWMLYVHKQFERPTDVMGVEVVVSVLDPNNNVYEVGRTTSDSSGAYGVAFTPEVPGKYTVIASFDGSKAYYGSFAETFINVEEAPAGTPEPTPTSVSAADLYLVPGVVSIIVAIAVVGAVIVLMLRKR